VAGEPDHKVGNRDFVDHLEKVIRQRAADLENERETREENLILKSPS
jgi:(E)-4-hydroxy-3-methylbut-2-enyl-diphosphate synthase